MNMALSGYVPTKEQEMLGLGLAKMVKRLVKTKKPPTQAEMTKLARLVNPSVQDDKDASLTLLGEGASTLVDTGVIESPKLGEFIEGLKGKVGSFENPSDFIEAAIQAAPIDSSIKMAAALLME